MGWHQSTLGKVVSEMRNGVNCKQNKDSIGQKITRIETISDARINLNRVGYSVLEEKQRKKYKLEKGDILFSHINSSIHVGKTAIFDVEEDVYHGVNLMLLRASLEVHPSFLNYYLGYIFKSGFWRGVCKQSVNQASVNQKDIKRVEIKYPPIPEQKRIVAILDQAFADIDKARAKTEQNLKNARELFESYLQQVSGEKKPLGEFVTIKTGKLNSNAAVEGGEFPFFTCSRDVFAIDRFSFDCEAILLAGNNASGDFNVKHYQGKFDAYQRTYVITIDDEGQVLYPFLFYQMLKSLKELKKSSVGAGTKFLKLDMIKQLRISVPAINDQKVILDTLLVLKKQIDKLEETYRIKLTALDELKKSILQKAFTGQLTAQDVA